MSGIAVQEKTHCSETYCDLHDYLINCPGICLRQDALRRSGDTRNYSDDHHGPMLLNEPYPGGDPFLNYDSDHTVTDELTKAIRGLTRMLKQMEGRSSIKQEPSTEVLTTEGYKWNRP